MKGFFSIEQVHGERPGSNLIPKCGVCGLYKGCHSPKMLPYGKGNKRVMIVGEAPGATEDEEDRPFVGKSGQYLRQALAAIGVSMDRDAVVTNALICRPPNNATPETKEIGYCRPNLLKTLQDVEPRVIVTLGRAALVAVLQDYWKEEIGPMERWVGWKIPIEKHWICPSYHPSYMLRSKNELLDRMFSNHMEEAFALDKLPEPQEDFKRHIEVIYDDEKVWDALQEMDVEGDWISFDFEANCLKPNLPKAQLFSCAVSNGYRTVAFPWIGKTPNAVYHLMTSHRTRKIAANMKNEETWFLEEFDEPVENWGWDPMIATHCLDNRQGICSLKFQMLVRLGIPLYNELIEPYLKSGEGSPYNRIKEADPDAILFYNGMDAIGAHRLAMLQRKEMGYSD
jgi:uracil-DNA glycosylase family 4